jgi:hypothetical protein
VVWRWWLAEEDFTSSASVFHDADDDCTKVEDFALFGGHEVQGDVRGFHELLSHGGGGGGGCCCVKLSIQLSRWLVGRERIMGLS